MDEENNSEEEKKNVTRIFYRSWEEGDKSNPWVVIDLKVVAQYTRFLLLAKVFWQGNIHISTKQGKSSIEIVFCELTKFKTMNLNLFNVDIKICARH